MSKFVDLTGQRFGSLTVTERAGTKWKSCALWKCKCDCGNEIDVVSADLNRGKCKTCGKCKTSQCKIKPGDIFGRWTVLRINSISDKGNTSCFCSCSCGTFRDVLAMHLLRGDSKSCGCLQKEMVRDRSITHGMHNTSIYRRWQNMLRRCNNPRTKEYKNYGGRGIKVCEEWLKFEVFYEWAIQNGYSDDLTIERIDVNGNYEPNNVSFISAFAQHSNRRDNVKLEYQGEINTMEEWGRILNIPASTIHNWHKAGLSMEEGILRRDNYKKGIRK
jgi:hypothetical protein